MQGDWMYSLGRLNRCADPRGLIKKRRGAWRGWGGVGDIIRPSDLLLHRSRKALRRLIRRLQGGQWDIDFPAPLLQLSQFTCLIDWWSFSYYTRSVVLQCHRCPPQRRQNPFWFTVSVFAYFSHIFTRVFECFLWELLTGNDPKLTDWFIIFGGLHGKHERPAPEFLFLQRHKNPVAPASKNFHPWIHIQDKVNLFNPFCKPSLGIFVHFLCPWLSENFFVTILKFENNKGS